MSRVLDLRGIVPDEDTGVFIENTTRLLGVSRRSVERWFVKGVSWERADSIAVKVLGAHPMELWGTDWANLADDASERRIAREAAEVRRASRRGRPRRRPASERAKVAA